MHSSIQFLSTPTADTPGTTLLLHFDNKRYLVGSLAEGTQRASVQRGVKLLKVSDIFITGRVEWANTGGLLGMILTLADVTSTAHTGLLEREQAKAGRAQQRSINTRPGRDSATAGRSDSATASPRPHDGPKLAIHGGHNLTHTLATARRFIFRKGMPVQVHEYLSPDLASSAAAAAGKGHTQSSAARAEPCPPSWSDENIKVWALPIRPATAAGALSRESVRSSRKRSFDELDEGNHHDASMIPDADEREAQMRKAVVSAMFNSSWRLDSLVEMRLCDVQLPATLFVRSPDGGGLDRYRGPLPTDLDASDRDHPRWQSKVWVRRPWPAALVASLPPTQPSPVAMSYIIKNHPQRGKFVPARAIKLGVKPGPDFARLTRGETVTVADGTVVSPDMVLERGKEGGGVAVVELPSSAYLSDLIGRPEWADQGLMNGVGAVVWILGAGLVHDDGWQRFVRTMPSLSHIVSSVDVCPNAIALDSAAVAAIRLHQISASQFPVPKHNNLIAGRALDAGLRAAQRGLTIQLEPSIEVQDHAVPPTLNTALTLHRTSAEVLQLAEQARETLASAEARKRLDDDAATLPGRDAEIVTLGTGSALPSKYRNVSATLLRVPGYGSYLFDCGENTLGQLRRVFDADELKAVLKDLRAIWISHLHADHHCGTVSVIRAWYEQVWGEGAADGPGEDADAERTVDQTIEVLQKERRLFVISDEAMLQMLREYASVEDFGHRKIVPLAVQSYRRDLAFNTRLTWNKLHMGPGAVDDRLNKAVTAATGFADFQTVDVSHCHGAKAVSVTFPDGFKFSYSGDCRPSKSFADIGRGSTVLVHEATFDDELRGEALAKKHSTISEALGVGIAMGARRVLLTHFSQRYQKIPVMSDVAGAELALEDDEAEVGHAEPLEPLDMAEHERGTTTARQPRPAGPKAVIKVRDEAVARTKIGVAFDYMRVKVGEISHLEYLTPALLKLYEVAEDEEKAATEARATADKERGPKANQRHRP